MMRRLLAAVTLAAVGLAVAVPLASAHVNDPDHEHILEWGRSPGPTTAGDGGQVWSNDEIVGAYARFGDGIRSWDVVIRPVNGGPASTCHEDLAQDQNAKYPVEVYISCPWDTTRATEHWLDGPTPGNAASNPRFTREWRSKDLGPAANGKYTIEVTVTNAGYPAFKCGLLGLKQCESRPVEPHPLYQPGTDPPRWREVFVVNGVGEPGGVSSAFDPATNRISVTWNPVAEPDASYVVQEKVGDGKWSSGVGVPGNRYERTVDQPGKYQYRVAAVRPAPTRDNGGATKRSEYVAASAVDVAQITPPTTAGGGPDATPSGEPGVFIPTDPTSPSTAPGVKPTQPPKSSARSNGRSTARPSGSTSRSTGSIPGEGEDLIDEGFSTELPYNRNRTETTLAEEDVEEEGEVQTLAGGVVPKPQDTRQLLIFMAGALTLFVFAMQLTVLLRRSRPVVATSGGGAQHQQRYHDDFDDWLGF